jgi:ABC-type antimicrobial peptide transport system permease subunit
VSAYLQDVWKELFPQQPYRGFYHDDIIAGDAQVTDSIRTVFLYIAIMVVIISGMGLFALVSLSIARRTKELGIRKVLGASVINIGFLITREFIILMAIGSLIAAALGYFLVDSLMSSIWTYYVDFGVTPFVFSAVVVLVIAMLTVSFQVYSVVTANPVVALRDE